MRDTNAASLDKVGKQIDRKIGISEFKLTSKGRVVVYAAQVQGAIHKSENRKLGQAQPYCLSPAVSRKKGN